MKTIVASAGVVGLLGRLWHHVSRRRRRQFLLLIVLICISAFAEVMSLGALLPFLSILVAPDKLFANHLVSNLAARWGFYSASDLLLPFTIAFVVAAVAAGIVRVLLLWVSTRLAYATGSDFCIDAYRRTLYQPYHVHVARNSSEVISGITTKVGDTVNVLNQVLTVISSVVLLVVITSALIAIDPVIAALATTGFGASYAVISRLYRRQLRRNSCRIAHAQTHLIKALQEGLGGIRDVLLDGTQAIYSKTYADSERALRMAQGSNTFASGSPRFAMEAVGMILIAALAYGISRQPGGFANALPVLGTLALGAQRLLPALQQCYSAWATIAGSHASLAKTVELLEQPLPAESFISSAEPLSFCSNASFHAVSFRFAVEGPWILDRLNLTINRGSRVGLVGSTGSGKSTTLDVLMGLLVPTEGALLVDGEPVTGDRIQAWQRTIAHVPQSIYLADVSIAENIAFGLAPGALDLKRVKLAARQAQIADFVETLDKGYDTIVGERGIRLSGGQRQRIGIARALYKQASLLVFDEATSALDNRTEESVMDAIDCLDRDLTIVLIAHRLTTVRRCDTIIELEQGRVVAQGTYEELLEKSPSFRKMAKAVA